MLFVHSFIYIHVDLRFTPHNPVLNPVFLHARYDERYEKNLCGETLPYEHMWMSFHLMLKKNPIIIGDKIPAHPN